MCGIFGFFGHQETQDISNKRDFYLGQSKKIRHRGPDWNGIYYDINNSVVICHERLSIIGVNDGSQPIIDNENNIILSVNGEIYNYKELYNVVLHNKYKPKTSSDCEIIIHMYKEFGPSCVKMLDGIFSFILFDKNNNKILVCRDSIGITSLYYGITENGEISFASEMKSLVENCVFIDVFERGHYYYDDLKINKTEAHFKNKLFKYYLPNWLNKNFDDSLDEVQICETINQSLTNAVKKRLMTDVPFGVLLSGGLDSSLIASITNRLMKDTDNKWGNKLHTFSIGLQDSPDLKKARVVSNYLNTIHHEYIYTIQEGIDALKELIYHLETYDITTIRASTPMYLMSRLIKSNGIKMVLSGEGADEIFGGYLYFHQAPNDEEFHDECIKRVNNLSHFDCLRANKSTMAWGLEARVPFLDKSFLEESMIIHPKLKLNKEKKIEKYILRKAFDDTNNPYLPDEILWRQKEQFSDGVGYGWIDSLIEHASNEISDEEFEKCGQVFPFQTPKNKEALFYRKIFNELFPGRDKVVPLWIPRTDWENVSYDPSGRAQVVHNKGDLSQK